MTKPASHRPPGFHTVTPYLHVRDAVALLRFIGDAFGGQIMFRMDRPDGTIAHAQIQVDDSVIEVSEASEQWGAMPCSLHVYLPDVDAAYARALAAGASSIYAPIDQSYGDREAGVRDAAGNNWWLATHIEDIAPEQLESRAAAPQ